MALRTTNINVYRNVGILLEINFLVDPGIYFNLYNYNVKFYLKFSDVNLSIEPSIVVDPIGKSYIYFDKYQTLKMTEEICDYELYLVDKTNLDEYIVMNGKFLIHNDFNIYGQKMITIHYKGDHKYKDAIHFEYDVDTVGVPMIVWDNGVSTWDNGLVNWME